MKLVGFLILLLLVGNDSQAACREHTEDNFTAEFNILSIDTPQISCLFDDKGGALTKPLSLDQPGCVLNLYVKKVRKGRLPEQKDWEKNKFSVYSNGSLCKKKIGSSFTRELTYSGGECCIENEMARNSGSQMYCKLQPKVEPLQSPTEIYIRCSQRSVNWKFVE